MFCGSIVELRIEDATLVSSNVATVMGLSYVFLEKGYYQSLALTKEDLWLIFQSLLVCENILVYFHCCYQYCCCHHAIEEQKLFFGGWSSYSKIKIPNCLHENQLMLPKEFDDRSFLFSWCCSFLQSGLPFHLKHLLPFLFENFLSKASLENWFLFWNVKSPRFEQSHSL